MSEDSAPNTQYPTPNTRFYRTGDLARYRSDGAIEFLGRLDQQIKIRGFRVEPGEIEATLCRHPAVHAAAAVPLGDADNKRLVAYVGLRTEGRGLSGADSSVLSPQSSVLTELRDFLKERLPEYMLPSAFVLLDALPLNPNGKLDLRALPDPGGARPAPEATYMAPRTDLEQQIAAIWQAVLGIEQVGVHDNFFDLGGHSFLLIQAHSRLCETLGQDLSVVELFQYPTISALARHINQEPPAQPAQRPQERADTRLDTMHQQRQFRQRSRSGRKTSR